MKKRNESIDFFRGLAAISVIFIHTVFHSGSSYVPSYIQNMSLFFDVPVFMFLSGMIFNYSKTPSKKVKEIFNIIKKWFFFTACCFIMIWLVNRENFILKDIFNWLVFNPTMESGLTISVNWSISFCKLYIQSSIICCSLIYLINRLSKENSYKNVLYLFVIVLYFLISSNYGVSFMNFSSLLLSYCLYFIMGYLAMSIKFKNIKSYLISMLVLFSVSILMFNLNGMSLSDLQLLKSNGHILYVIISLFSFLTIIYFKDNFKFNNKICEAVKYIGRDALFMFFAQGISSSILFKIVPLVKINVVVLKVIIMFLINLLFALVIFVVLSYLYKIVDKYVFKKIDFSKIINYFFEKKDY